MEKLALMAGEIRKQLDKLEERIASLEKEESKDVVCMDLVLPEADISGLHFNKTEVHAVFEKQEDGWYYSVDILFLSARNVGDDNDYDALMKYLNGGGGDGIKVQLAGYFDVYPAQIEVSLPKKNKGDKKYNGVKWWYWLLDKPLGSMNTFRTSIYNGHANPVDAFAVGGCAPVFRILEEAEDE
jgi:hypothetical protein